MRGGEDRQPRNGYCKGFYRRHVFGFRLVTTAHTNLIPADASRLSKCKNFQHVKPLVRLTRRCLRAADNGKISICRFF
ncbi:hypothetical protein HMPREF9123_2608 [Neisseria bacilliformis ATCC BAA-1200]|uniref:Uncharacterized protein n=1 Tax=Neisseria bacilliformis ATCC BAA-1200 TaxID=888742 RepID=F2BFV1_9NEIS|nr:hypothetical protein HMPREF9123_2608 [Neisseria bacilliformis ATCC BAA-1200]